MRACPPFTLHAPQDGLKKMPVGISRWLSLERNPPLDRHPHLPIHHPDGNLKNGLYSPLASVYSNAVTAAEREMDSAWISPGRRDRGRRTPLDAPTPRSASALEPPGSGVCIGGRRAPSGRRPPTAFVDSVGPTKRQMSVHRSFRC